jgi:hypothetical protein
MIGHQRQRVCWLGPEGACLLLPRRCQGWVPPGMGSRLQGLQSRQQWRWRLLSLQVSLMNDEHPQTPIPQPNLTHKRLHVRAQPTPHSNDLPAALHFHTGAS